MADLSAVDHDFNCVLVMSVVVVWYQFGHHVDSVAWLYVRTEASGDASLIVAFSNNTDPLLATKSKRDWRLARRGVTNQLDLRSPEIIASYCRVKLC